MADLSVKILEQIRDELTRTRTELRGELGELRNEVRQTRTELSARIDRLEKRQTESEIRIATELVAVAGAIHEVRDKLVESLKLRDQLGDLERRIGALERGAT